MIHSKTISIAILILFIIYCSGVYSNQDGESSKAIHVSLVSNWESTPLYLESFMFFKNRVEETIYHKYIENLSLRSSKSSYSKQNDQEKFQTIVDSASEVLGDDTQYFIGSLRADLSMRTFSPKVELLRQLYHQTLNKIDSTKKSIESLIQISNPGKSSSTTATTLLDVSIDSIDGAIKKLSPTNNDNLKNDLVVYSFDTVFSGSELRFDSQLLVDNQLPVVIYYANVMSESFLAIHKHLVKLSKEQSKIVYVLRFAVESSGEVPAKLQGYGYGLAIKNLEYKVMDDSVIAKDEQQEGSGDMHEDVAGFNFKVLQDRHPQLSNKFKTFRKFLMARQQTTELKIWEIKDIGLQSAQKIISSSDPMRSMRYITSTFPSLSHSLARISLNDSLKQHIEENQKAFTPGSNHLFLNDINFNLEEEFQINPLGLNEILLNEIKSKVEMSKLGLSGNVLNQVGSVVSKLNPVRFDVIPDEDIVVFVNNLEKDYNYQRWDRSFSAIDGNLDENSVYMAKNIFTGIVVIDLDSEDAFQTISQIGMFVNNNVPIRFGFLFATESGNGQNQNQGDRVSNEEVVKIFWSFHKNMGSRAAFYFINALNYFRNQYDSNYNSFSLVQAAYQTVVNQMHGRMPGTMRSIMSSNELKTNIVAANQYISSKGWTQFPQLYINGLMVELKNGIPMDELLSLVQDEMHEIQRLYKDGAIDDTTSDIYKTMMEYYRDSTGLMSSFSPIIIPSEQSPLRYVSLTYSPDNELQKLANKVLSDLNWFQSSESNDLKVISTMVIGNLDESESSIRLALNALQRFDEGTTTKMYSQVRYALISTGSGSISKVLAHSDISIQGATLLLKQQLEQLENKATPLTLEKALSIAKLSNQPLLNERFEKQQDFVRYYMKLSTLKSQSHLVVNGRLITIDENDVFDEFQYLETYEAGKSKNVMPYILQDNSFVDSSLKFTNSQYSTILMRLMSSLGKRTGDTTTNKKKPPVDNLKPSFIYNPKEDSPLASLLEFNFVVNPLSKVAQKVIPIVAEFSQHFGIPCKVYLNTMFALSEVPLKNYYTYVVQLDNQYKDGKVVSEPGGTLVNLPESRVLTLAMDAPVEWIVSPIVAKYDLDNIRLKDLGNEKVMRAVYALEHLMVQGQSLDVGNFQPPGGLELQLSSLDSKVSTDTLVMGNGYFQLQGNPGVWTLDTIGRGNDIFDTLNIQDRKYASIKAAHSIPHLSVNIDSFKGSNVFLGLQRKEGQERTPILPPVEENSQPETTVEEDQSIGSAILDFFGSGGKKKQAGIKVTSTNETIHVFSVASGHLYERFLKIMMLSVKKHTNNPVKFWFLKNYLSPKFVDFIPQFAKQYGFEYELVTYQWPPWLRAQTEKQRIIWAYKILFLDVLFPLSVKKIIFVDADQVVRTDLKELWDMDLHGASIGMTPFCDSNKDTEGFRFWKSGFWRDHLRGKPYHISALYVVDLQRFRRIIAGDNLRMTYDQLSRDPNSLANLDQDLPNYLQHSVRIFSLPQEWLWCETWCSQESKPKAKTIDLCNNPMTKTPKLENAVRIIDEWTSLDNEAKNYEKEYEKVKQSKQQQQQQKNAKPTTSGASKDSQTIATTEYQEPTNNQDVINAALAEAAKEFI